MILLLILICLALGGYGGYRIGSYFIRQENDVLLTQVYRLDTYSRTWAAAAENSFQLTNQLAQHHSQTAAATISTVVQLLQSLQQQDNGSALNPTDKLRIQSLIDQARLITPTAPMNNDLPEWSLNEGKSA